MERSENMNRAPQMPSPKEMSGFDKILDATSPAGYRLVARSEAAAATSNYFDETVTIPAVEAIDNLVQHQSAEQGEFYQPGEAPVATSTELYEQYPVANEAFQEGLSEEQLDRMQSVLDEQREELKKEKIAKEKAAEEKRIIDERLAEEKRIAEEAAAAEARALAEVTKKQNERRLLTIFMNGLNKPHEPLADQSHTTDEALSQPTEQSIAGSGDMPFTDIDGEIFKAFQVEIKNNPALDVKKFEAGLRRQLEEKAAQAQGLAGLAQSFDNPNAAVDAQPGDYRPAVSPKVTRQPVPAEEAYEPIDMFDATTVVPAIEWPATPPTGNTSNFTSVPSAAEAAPSTDAPKDQSVADVPKPTARDEKLDSKDGNKVQAQSNRWAKLTEKYGGNHPKGRAAVAGLVALGLVGGVYAVLPKGPSDATELVGGCFNEDPDAEPLMKGALHAKSDVKWTVPDVDNEPFLIPPVIEVKPGSAKTRDFQLAIKGMEVEATVCAPESAEESAVEVTNDSVIVHADRLEFQAVPIRNAEDDTGKPEWESPNGKTAVLMMDNKIITSEVSAQMVASAGSDKSLQLGVQSTAEQAYERIEAGDIDKKITKKLSATASKLLKERVLEQTKKQYPDQEMEVIINGKLPSIDFEGVDGDNAKEPKPIDLGSDISVSVENVDVKKFTLKSKSEPEPKAESDQKKDKESKPEQKK